MDILRRIQDQARECPDRVAVQSGSSRLSYGELWEYSERLAFWLLQKEDQDRAPVAVYGHKHPWMLVCFLACVKAGRAYCPVDISVPDARVEAILRALPSRMVLTTESFGADAGDKHVISLEELEHIVTEADGGNAVSESDWVHGGDTYYIIFTSGSTGTPKGVQITADCLNHYLDWSVTLGTSPEEKQGQVFLNQAPFSFDLSVMDLYTSLASGGTLYCLEKSVQSDYRALVQSLKESKANVWVSTPSFAEVCLSERAFSEEMMPELQVFLFCGETLANKTSCKLQKRFPNARIINTYGPTESTVAVTDVSVTPELVEAEDPLPVGRPKPGTRILIWNEDGKEVPEGEKGEIIIVGDTVSIGYYGRQDLTEKAFFCFNGERGYHTGDKGYLKDGMLYYCGRIDLQIKLHGYRIELEDIENNIARLPQVEQAVVAPNFRGGKVVSLTAYVVKYQEKETEISEYKKYAAKTADMPEDVPESGSILDAADMKAALKQFLPDYMVPKKIVFLDKMPVTNNGKVDRKALAEGAVRPKSTGIQLRQTETRPEESTDELL
ncbi:MAG: D-alanine--poly(phosphoribitol) ligase subunit DltA [Lachnospiraceae bacterium]|nr:D-alanine--poly(phosphoribitol) ligase subunit DltA [Lachnospiraceae bacterium]